MVAAAAAQPGSSPPSAAALDSFLQSPFSPPLGVLPKHVAITVPDSDPRALIHCAGVAPNKWGTMQDGSDVRDLLGVFPLSANDQAAADAYQARRYGTTAAATSAAALKPVALKDLPSGARRAQPLWPAAALSLAQEVLNRRLFSEVRERRGLTYDANFQLTAHERLGGGWWLVTVTSSPANAQLALDAAVESLTSIAPDPSKPFGASYPLTKDNLMAAQRVLVQRHTSELRSNKYWTEILTGAQLPCVGPKEPGNGAAYQREWADTVRAITLADVELMFQALSLTEAQMYTCVAQSAGRSEPLTAEEEAAAAAQAAALENGHTMPSLSRR